MVITTAGLGLIIASQAPEFAQQYRQRLGGAVEELRIVAENFDRDAEASGMTRRTALLSMRQSDNTFSRDRSLSMEKTFSRFETLRGQRAAMEMAGDLARPANIIANPDRKILRDTWTDFEPAVPITLPGLIWGGFGALFGAGLMLALLRLASLARRVRKKPVTGMAAAVKSDLKAPRILHQK